MKVIYDPQTDTLDLIFRDEPVAESDEIHDGVIIDYAKDGRPVSVEVLDASKLIPEPGRIIHEVKSARG